jgi:hypothetical protein
MKIRCTSFAKWFRLTIQICAVFILHERLYAQTVLHTDPALTNATTYGTVTFNFENTNPFPVIITDISGIVSEFGSQLVEVWFKPTPVNGAPGMINAGNGWQPGGAATTAGVANTSTTAIQPLLGGLGISVPANTTYGFALSAHFNGTGTLRGSAFTTNPVASAGGCNIIMNATSSFADPQPLASAPATPSVGWIGSIRFVNGSPCNAMPAAAVISGPGSVCAGARFSLSSSAVAGLPGLNYQWQYFNTLFSSWQDAAAGTTPVLTVLDGINVATQYRLKTECLAVGQSSYSNIITVNVATTLPAGVYTINKNAASTQTNFISFSDAAQALKCGISGPVTLNVVPGSGPYTEQPVFPHVPGNTVNNRIRINGNGEVLQAEANVGTNAVLLLQGADYLTVDSLTIRTLNTTGPSFGILLRDTCYNDSILNCFVDVRSLYENVGGSASAGISMSNWWTIAGSTPGQTQMSYVGNNHILASSGPLNAMYGIVCGNNYGVAYNWQSDSGNVIAHNEVENFTYGIYNYGSRYVRILYNDIHRKNKQGTTPFYGILCWSGWWANLSTQQREEAEIIGNRIHSPGVSNNMSGGFWGIYASSNYNTGNNPGSRLLIANNAVYDLQNLNQNSATIYGIMVYNYGVVTASPDTIIIAHNTIDLNFTAGSSGNTHGIYYNYVTQNNNLERFLVYNNLVTIAGGSTGAKYGFFHSEQVAYPNSFYSQRNNFYLSPGMGGPQFYGRYGGINYATMADFQAAYPTLEQGSLSVDPLYTNPAIGDLTPMNYSLLANGVNLLDLVPKDILGRPRSATPTPGAFEIAVDAGVEALAAPLGTYCSSVKEVKVNIKNNGGIPINTVNVHWSLNGVLQTPVTYTGSIAAQGTAVVSLGNGLFLPGTPVVIKAWTHLPNGLADPFNYNDTLLITTQSSTSIPVNLGPDAAICTGASYTLNAGYPGSIYLWDDNSNQQTRTVNQAGTYYVRVTALDGCLGVDTFNLTLRPLPVVDLGPDFAICWGAPTTLDAGHPGASYNWDDGSSGQTRTVDTAGTYYVEVTDVHGCMGSDEVVLILKDLPSASGINATHADSGLYTFFPLNPQYSSSYRWNFGDGSAEVWGHTVQHAYTTPGIYTVTLFLEGECTGLIIEKTRTVDVFVVPGGGTSIVSNAGTAAICMYPNPARDMVYIESEAADLSQITVYNILGQLVYHAPAEDVKLHRIPVQGLASGTYTVLLQTTLGTVTRKLELVK